MKWNNIKITIHKELRGIIRDKKSMQKIILLPFMIPFIIVLFGFLFDQMDNSKYVVGINYQMTDVEEEIVKDIKNISFQSYDSKEKLVHSYETGEINGYIVNEENQYTIYADTSVNSGDMIQYYSTSYLESYSQYLASEYLIGKGIDIDKVYNNLTIDVESLAKEETTSLFTTLLNLVVTYVLMILVMACVVVATDATSGEKERGTLETILTFPVKCSELVAGKYLATAILGCVVGIFSYLLTLPTFYMAKEMFTSFKDLTISFNFLSTILVLLVIVMASLLTAGVCMALAGKAKTYKEAQSSLQFVSFLPMIPYFVKILEADNSIFSFVPIANCGMALNDITMNTIDPKSLLIIFVSTIVYIVLILIFISKQYSSEKTLFS